MNVYHFDLLHLLNSPIDILLLYFDYLEVTFQRLTNKIFYRLPGILNKISFKKYEIDDKQPDNRNHSITTFFLLFLGFRILDS